MAAHKALPLIQKTPIFFLYDLVIFDISVILCTKRGSNAEKEWFYETHNG